MKQKDKQLRAEKESIGEHDQAGAELETACLIARNMRFGWWSLLLFLALGMILETLHVLKVDAYLDVANSTRRLMWTLAHAHGTLFSMLNIAFAITLSMLPGWTTRSRRFASHSLILATVLMPAGFFLGGVVFYSGDPGLGILLVPLGALALLAAVFVIGRGAAQQAGGRVQREPSKGKKGGSSKSYSNSH